MSRHNLPWKWERPTEKAKAFPKDKYGFTKHLTNAGDWVETDVLYGKEVKNIIDAAHAWAWFHKYTVKCNSFLFKDGKCVRITLVKKHRFRDYA